MGPWPLSELYLRQRPTEEATLLPSVSLEETLAELLTATRRALPALVVPPEDFLPYLGSRRPDPACLQPERAVDLYVACGCALGLAYALGAFERLHLAGVPAVVARVDPAPDFGSEVQCQLRARLLTRGPAGEAPLISRYRAHGSLAGWVRVAALRTALNLRRGQRRRREDLGAALPEALLAEDAELAYIRDRYRDDFEQALRESLSALAAEDRSLLRLRFQEGVGSGRLARILGVDRSTVVRRLQTVRGAVFAEARRIIKEKLRIDTEEFDSLLRVMGAELELSLSVLLEES